MDCSTPGLPVLHHLLELAQTHVPRVDDAIQPSRPLSSLSPPGSIFPHIRVFSNESVLCIRWPKYWSFSISSSKEYLGLISFRMDWLDLLAVQGTLKSLLQHHSPKASVLQCSAQCPGVSGRGTGRQRHAAGSGALNTTVLGAVACWHVSFWRRSPLLSLLPLS